MDLTKEQKTDYSKVSGEFWVEFIVGEVFHKGLGFGFNPRIEKWDMGMSSNKE